MKTNRNKPGTINFEAMEKRELFTADLGIDLAIATNQPEPQAAWFAKIGDIEGTSKGVKQASEQSIDSPNTDPAPPPLADFHNAVCDLILVTGSATGGQPTPQGVDSVIAADNDETTTAGYSDVKRVAIKIGSHSQSDPEANSDSPDGNDLDIQIRTRGRTGYSDVKRVAIKIGSNPATSLAIDSLFASSSYNDLSVETCDPTF